MDVRLYHPDLDVEIAVPEGSAWVRLENGWKYADEAEEAPKIYDTAGPPVPVDKEDE